MALYDKLALVALRLLTKYGTDVVLRQLSAGGGDYDPSTGEAIPEGNDGSSDSKRKALVLDQPGTQISQRFGSTLQSNNLIQQGEKWLYMDAKGAPPVMQDKLILTGIEYVIIDVQEYGPGAVPILYLLVVRK
jgi:hypothetical protein